MPCLWLITSGEQPRHNGLRCPHNRRRARRLPCRGFVAARRFPITRSRKTGFPALRHRRKHVAEQHGAPGTGWSSRSDRKAGIYEEVWRRRGNQTCNFDFANQSAAGFKYTFQVTRADFDKTLADAVAARGVPILYGHSVTNVSFGSSHATITLAEPGDKQRTVTARFVLDCSGYGRVLPRMLKLEEPSSFPPRESLFAHVSGDVRPDGREEGKIWVCIHPGGAWIGSFHFRTGIPASALWATPNSLKTFLKNPKHDCGKSS